jgi:hypothetical protein
VTEWFHHLPKASVVPDFEKAGYQGHWLPGRRISGDHGLVIVVKRRFDVDTASARCAPADITEPVVLCTEFADPENAAESPVAVPSEIACEKVLVDLMLKGTAYAPFGRPVPQFEVGVKIAGVINRSLLVQGDREAHYVAPKKMLTRKQREKGEQQEYPPPVFSEAEPLKELPLSYEFAYGGVGKVVLDAFVQEMADEAQADAELLEERRKRKKEIEEELLAEEEAKEEAAKKEASRAKGGLGDEQTAEKAGKAFGDSGTQMLDTSMLEELEASDAEPDMKKVSEYRLGKDMPDRPEEVAQDEEAAESDDSPFVSGTQILDIADLPSDGDELKVALDARAVKDARQLKDKEGALRVQATEFEDIELSDEEWIAKYGKKLRKKKKKKRAPSEFPEIPYPANPSGRGFCVGPLKEAVDGTQLPNFEWPEDILTPDAFVCLIEELDFNALRAPAGFSCYPLSWFPRVKHAGVYPWDMGAAEEAKAKALEDYDEEDPADKEAIEIIKNQSIPVMAVPFFQEAHPRLQVERVNGDEEVLLTNLTPDGNLFFRLPGTHPKVTLDLGKGAEPVFSRLDTVTLDVEDPKKPAVELIWRGWVPMKDLSDLDTIQCCEVNIEDVDQTEFFDLAREAEKGAPSQKEEGTRMLQAMGDDEEAEAPDGKEIEAEYMKLVSRRRDEESLGAAKDESGVKVFDQSQERQLTDDEWDEEIRGNKGDIDEIVKKQKKATKKKKKADIRKKARKKADEELGIEWTEEEGEDS